MLSGELQGWVRGFADAVVYQREENEFILKILEFDYFHFCSQASVTSRL